MAKYEIQYLDALNKMNLDPDDLVKSFQIDGAVHQLIIINQ